MTKVVTMYYRGGSAIEGYYDSAEVNKWLEKGWKIINLKVATTADCVVAIFVLEKPVYAY